MKLGALSLVTSLAACSTSPLTAADAGTDAGPARADAAALDGGAADGGLVECAAPCEGDLVCGSEGYCGLRPEGDFDRSCANNLTIQCFPCRHTFDDFDYVDATVCNRGASEAAADQLVRFESAGEVICEARTEAAIAPGHCLDLRCPLSDRLGDVTTADTVRATVSPDGAALECGDPLDNSMEAGIAIGCE